MVHTKTCNKCNMGMRALPDMYAQVPKGIHIRQGVPQSSTDSAQLCLHYFFPHTISLWSCGIDQINVHSPAGLTISITTATKY